MVGSSLLSIECRYLFISFALYSNPESSILLLLSTYRLYQGFVASVMPSNRQQQGLSGFQ